MRAKALNISFNGELQLPNESLSLLASHAQSKVGITWLDHLFASIEESVNKWVTLEGLEALMPFISALAFLALMLILWFCFRDPEKEGEEEEEEEEESRGSGAETWLSISLVAASMLLVLHLVFEFVIHDLTYKAFVSLQGGNFLLSLFSYMAERMKNRTEEAKFRKAWDWAGGSMNIAFMTFSSLYAVGTSFGHMFFPRSHDERADMRMENAFVMTTAVISLMANLWIFFMRLRMIPEDEETEQAPSSRRMSLFSMQSEMNPMKIPGETVTTIRTVLVPKRNNVNVLGVTLKLTVDILDSIVAALMVALVSGNIVSDQTRLLATTDYIVAIWSVICIGAFLYVPNRRRKRGN